MILFIQLSCLFTLDNSNHHNVFYYAAFTPKLRTAIHMFFEAEILRIVAGVLHIGNLARIIFLRQDWSLRKNRRGFPQSLKHNKYGKFNYRGWRYNVYTYVYV